MRVEDSLEDSVEQIRVALVDDQQLVRSGFRMLIDSQPDLHVVAEAADGLEACQAFADGGAMVDADVVLMDIRMPRMDGIAATTRMLEESARRGVDAPRVLMLTTFDLDEYVLDAISAGAAGFLLKDAPPEDLLDAIRTVFHGGAVVAPSSTKRLLDHMAPMLRAQAQQDGSSAHDVVELLTARELEVFRLMAQGFSNTEIADQLTLSEATVKTHVGRVLSKLEVRDRVQAVVLAYRTGVVQP